MLRVITNISLCMLGNIFHNCLSSADFFSKIYCFETFFQEYH